MTADLSELIAKLEGAAAPNRGLDGEIHMAVTGKAHVMLCHVPAYTSSIDMALTLGRTPSERLSLLDDAVRAIAKRHHLHIQRLPDDADVTFEVCREVLIAAIRARATAAKEASHAA